MKKIPILLSILITSLLLSPVKSSFAMMEDRDTTWWTVEEMLAFYEEVEAEKQAECGDNQDCKIEFNFTMYDKGPKYAALENFLQGQIWITSINPAAETVKVLFFDEDMMLKRMGIEEKLELEHLYIGWFDEWQGQIYNYDHDRFTNGSMPDSHPLYDSIVEDISVIIPWEEVELSVAGGNLIENPTGKLDYAVFAKYNMFNAQGHFDYSSCLNAPDYDEAGLECRLMVSGDQWVSYFPPREQIAEQEDVEDFINILSETEPKSEPEPEVTEPETINLSTESTDEPQIDSISTPILESSAVALSNPESKPIIIKAPETGQGTANSGDAQLIWLLLIAITGILLAIWWFIPTETQRIRKKMKKTLDKKGQVR